MSIQAMSWVIENSKHTLGNLVVLLMVANHTRSDGTGAWPSVATLAKEARMSERGVQYCLRELEESGELASEIGAGPHGTNMYSLPLMEGAKSAPLKSAPVQNSSPGGAKSSKEGVNPSAPNPSFKRTEENREASPPFYVNMINEAIEESQITHEPADSILARLRMERGYPKPR